MPFNPVQFEDLVDRTLERAGMRSASAVQLVLGTCAVESDFGTYLHQLHGGPGRGVFSMEPETFHWLRDHYCQRWIEDLWWVSTDFEAQEWDLASAIVFCRLRYRVRPEPLPAPGDIAGLAEYWKAFYNTRLGSGAAADFIEKYHLYIRS